MSKEDKTKGIKFNPHTALENWIPEVYLVKDGKIHPIEDVLIKESDCVLLQGKMSAKEIIERFQDVLTDKEKELLHLSDDEN